MTKYKCDRCENAAVMVFEPKNRDEYWYYCANHFPENTSAYIGEWYPIENDECPAIASGSVKSALRGLTAGRITEVQPDASERILEAKREFWADTLIMHALGVNWKP